MLPAVGTCNYNGFDFGAAVRSKVATRFQYDDADRTVVAAVYTFTLSTLISEASAGAGCDTEVAAARILLSKAGQAFSFALKGFGNFTVNVSSVKDVAWGPKPRLLRLEPLGSRAMWALEWTCEVAVPECSAALYQFGIMGFNYEATFSFDERRYTTRNITGYIEIPMTRAAGGRTLTDTADAYRERLNFPIPDGFRRVPEVYKISADKRRLDFSITDQEMVANALPVGCVHADGTIRTGSADKGLAKFNVSIAASYIVAKGQPRSAAFDAFYALVFDRITHSIRRTSSSGGVPVVYDFQFEEGIYQNAPMMSFELSYFVTTSFEQVFNDTGTWREVPGTNSRQWAASVLNVMGPRASAGLRLQANQDIIIDLCGQTQYSPPQPGASLSTRENVRELSTATPPALLEYRAEMKTMQTLKTAYHTKLPAALSTNVGNPGSANGVASLENFNPLTSDNSPAQPATNSSNQQANPKDNGLNVAPQQRTPDEFDLVLRGFAVTTWKPVPAPKLMRFPGGIAIFLPYKKHTYNTRFLGLIGGSTPVYLTEWFQTYRICLKKGRKFKAPVFSAGFKKSPDSSMFIIGGAGQTGRWASNPTTDLTGVFGGENNF